MYTYIKISKLSKEPVSPKVFPTIVKIIKKKVRSKNILKIKMTPHHCNIFFNSIELMGYKHE